MNNIISLVIGDWSGDGHDKKETITIESNLTVEELKKAYKAGTKKVGFDLINKLCCNWQDNSMSKSQFDILVKLGFHNDDIEEDEEDDSVFLWYQTYTDIYLFIVQLGNPEFKYNIAKGNSIINIGGYGLFE